MTADFASLVPAQALFTVPFRVQVAGVWPGCEAVSGHEPGMCLGKAQATVQEPLPRGRDDWTVCAGSDAIWMIQPVRVGG
jgi:hypothetical protein